MWKTIAMAGAAAVAIGGAGTAVAPGELCALERRRIPGHGPEPIRKRHGGASLDVANTATTDADKPQGDKRKAVNRLRGTVHATWVSKNRRNGTFTTHQAIRGQVTAVSARSITVKAADSVTETYVLNASTKVHSRATKAAALISTIKTGDPVLVAGTGTTTLTALRVVEAKK